MSALTFFRAVLRPTLLASTTATNRAVLGRAGASCATAFSTTRRSSTQCDAGQGPSVSADEVAKFSRMSADWWAPEGHFQMLHQMNPARVAYLRTFVPSHLGPAVQEPMAAEGRASEAPPSLKPMSPLDAMVRPFTGLRMLDVGCGGGLLCESLARLGGQVTGIDASFDNIQIARLHAQQDPRLSDHQATLTYQHITTDQLKTAGTQHDVVTSLEVIEHVLQPDQFVQDLFELTRPGGLVFLSTIARTPLAYGLTILGAEKLLRMVPEGTHDYHKYLLPSELTQFTSRAGGRVLDLRGIWYNPLQARWVLMDPSLGSMGTQANYILVARKL